VIGFFLPYVPGNSVVPSQRDIIDKSDIRIAEVQCHMRQFMQEAEPEVINSVIPESRVDDGCAVRQFERRSIQIRPLQVIQHDKMDSKPGQEIPRQ